MIVTLFLNIWLSVIYIVFYLFPTVDTLPTIFGFDIDGAMVTGMGQLNTVFGDIWALGIVFQGFLVLMGYYLGKIILKLILGSRSPAHN